VKWARKGNQVFLDDRDLTLRSGVVELDRSGLPRSKRGDPQSAARKGVSTPELEFLVQEGCAPSSECRPGHRSALCGLDFFHDNPSGWWAPTEVSQSHHCFQSGKSFPDGGEIPWKTSRKLLAAIEGIDHFVNSQELKETVVHLNAR